MREDTVRAKVNHQTKVSAQRVLKELGLTMSEAINLMLIQVTIRKGLPFEVTMCNVPNAETAQELKETDAGKGLIQCKDIDDLYDQIGI